MSGLKVYKVIRTYWVPASSKQAALDAMHQENIEQFFDSEFAVEPRPEGWLRAFLKQLVG